MTVAIAGMSAEGATISQSLQTCNAHQQNLGTELSLFPNVPVLNMQQQVTNMQQQFANMAQDIQNIRQEMQTMRQEVQTMGQDLRQDFRQEMQNMSHSLTSFFSAR